MNERLERTETRAVRIAESYYSKAGWRVTNVSRVGGVHAGYDLHLEREGASKTVEVKGCTTLYGIPDLYASEIDAHTGMLVADELCVVYLLPDEPHAKVALIPRDLLRAEHVVPKAGFRIRGTFKNARTIGPLLQDVEFI